MLIIKISQFLRQTQKLPFTHSEVGGCWRRVRPYGHRWKTRKRGARMVTRPAAVPASARATRIGAAVTVGSAVRGAWAPEVSRWRGPLAMTVGFPSAVPGDTGGPELLHRWGAVAVTRTERPHQLRLHRASISLPARSTRRAVTHCNDSHDGDASPAKCRCGVGRETTAAGGTCFR